MKRLILLALILSSCALFGSNEKEFDITTGPGAVLGSSEDITSFSSLPEGVCRYQVTSAGGKRAIACKTPAQVTVVTTGRVVVRLLTVAP